MVSIEQTCTHHVIRQAMVNGFLALQIFLRAYFLQSLGRKIKQPFSLFFFLESELKIEKSATYLS